MTLDEIITICKSVEGKWRLDLGRIRVTHDSRNFCPLTLCDYVINKKYVMTAHAFFAGKRLGLPDDLAKYVVEAADREDSCRHGAYEIRARLISELIADKEAVQ